MIHITDPEGKVIESWTNAGAMYEGMNLRYKHLQAKRRKDRAASLQKGIFIGMAISAALHILLFLTFKYLQ